MSTPSSPCTNSEPATACSISSLISSLPNCIRLSSRQHMTRHGVTNTSTDFDLYGRGSVAGRILDYSFPRGTPPISLPQNAWRNNPHSGEVSPSSKGSEWTNVSISTPDRVAYGVVSPSQHRARPSSPTTTLKIQISQETEVCRDPASSEEYIDRPKTTYSVANAL